MCSNVSQLSSVLSWVWRFPSIVESAENYPAVQLLLLCCCCIAALCRNETHDRSYENRETVKTLRKRKTSFQVSNFILSSKPSLRVFCRSPSFFIHPMQNHPWLWTWLLPIGEMNVNVLNMAYMFPSHIFFKMMLMQINIKCVKDAFCCCQVAILWQIKPEKR